MGGLGVVEELWDVRLLRATEWGQTVVCLRL